MRARRMLPVVGLVLSAISLAAMSIGSPAVAAPEQPNIIIILADDQRLGLVDAQPTVRNRIQNLGVTYSNYMVPTALCCPSRASLLTGKFAHGTGVWGNGLANDPPLSGAHPAFVANGNEPQTMAAALDPAGYRTVLIGKYLNQYFDSHGVPIGWDEFKAFSGKPKYYDYTLGGVQYGTSVADYSTDVIAQLSVEAINSTQTEPLFLYIAPFAPHSPFTPAPRHENAAVGQFIHPRDFGAINEADISDKPQYIRQLRTVSEERMREVARLQHRAVMGIDDLTADVVDALRDQDMLGDTMVIYASDNGILWGEHKWTGKNVPYWRATEVPLFIRWDGRLPRGTVDDRIALNVDVTATIAEAAGVDMPWSEGRSLVSGAARLGFVLEAIGSYPPFATRPAYCGWRSPGRLYVRYATGEEELYLYRSDPLERQNLAGERAYASRLASMRSNAVKACNPVPPDFTWNP